MLLYYENGRVIVLVLRSFLLSDCLFSPEEGWDEAATP